MAVYRGRKQPNKAVIATVVVLVVGALVLAVVFALRRSPPASPLSPEEARQQETAQEIQHMVSGLDLLIISHYTDEVVQDGQVLLPAEYLAAQQNVQQIQKRFEGILANLDSERAAEIETALAELKTLVEDKAPAVEVEVLAEKLIGLLNGVDG